MFIVFFFPVDAGGASHSDDAHIVRANGLQAGAVLPLLLRDYRRLHMLPAGTLVRGVPSAEGEGGCEFQTPCHSGKPHTTSCCIIEGYFLFLLLIFSFVQHRRTLLPVLVGL